MSISTRGSLGDLTKEVTLEFSQMEEGGEKMGINTTCKGFEVEVNGGL